LRQPSHLRKNDWPIISNKKALALSKDNVKTHNRVLPKPAVHKEKAQAAFCTQHYPQIRRHIASCIHSSIEAEDLAQDVFTRLWKNRQQYAGRSSVMTYLIGIANNVMANENKRLAREAKFFSDKLLQRLLKNPNALADPQLRACRTEFIKALEQTIAQLTNEQKHAVRLIYYEGLSLEQAAEQCNCSTKAIESRLYRARKRLQQLLSYLKP